MPVSQYKVSKYNFFSRLENGNLLAFNAMSCGLGVIDDETYAEYRLLEENPACDGIRKNTIEALCKGRFIIPDELEEIEDIKASHFISRFANNGYGLTLVPTMACNFACSYCYEPSKDTSPRPEKTNEMPEEFDEQIISLLRPQLHPGANLTNTWYGGEPLLALERICTLSEKMMKMCYDNKLNYMAGIITNGYLLTKEVLLTLVQYKVRTAQITLDGPKSVHDMRRPLKDGSGTFEKVVGNIMSIPDDFPFEVSIRVNVDKRNRETCLQLLSDLQRLEVHKRKNISIALGQVRELTPFCRDGQHCMNWAEFSELEVEFYRRMVNLGFRLSKYPSRQVTVCGAINVRSSMILPNGEIHKCWCTAGQSEFAVASLTPNSCLPKIGRHCKFSPNIDPLSHPILTHPEMIMIQNDSVKSYSFD